VHRRGEQAFGYFATKAPSQRRSSAARQLVQHAHTQQHNQQPNRHDNQQHEPEPAQHHGRGTNAALDAAVPKVLRYRGGGDGSRVLPQHADEHEDGGDEDERERDLADGPRGEGLDVDFGAGFFVLLVVPPGEGGEEDEADEGEDDSDDAKTRCVSKE
jgi:hypothetical protein